jgi:hypothetical protein
MKGMLHGAESDLAIQLLVVMKGSGRLPNLVDFPGLFYALHRVVSAHYRGHDR